MIFSLVPIEWNLIKNRRVVEEFYILYEILEKVKRVQ
jgi:hypothetical protein